MEKFVNIQTFFTSDKDRIVDDLKMIYNDSEKLEFNIKKIVDNIFLNSIHNKRILLKPNWVVESSNPCHEYCLRFNDNLLLVFVEVLLQNDPASIIIADAPVQNANWGKIVPLKLETKLHDLSVRYNVPIIIKDLRRKILDPHSIHVKNALHPLSEYVILDVGEKSFLESISTENKPFRVLGYDYRKTNKVQKKGTHQYCISKEMFDADIIISMPKVKTHQKTGITAALKNLVGLNGDKDYLPHHRLGGTGVGGDCYPGNNLLRLGNEYLIDIANRYQGSPLYLLLRLLARFFWELSFPGRLDNRGAAWFGNDTCWRMVMDLNTIVLYGKSDGTISDTPQRELYSFCDGIIGGQGNGPLNPEPLALGILSFTNSSALNDACMTQLMGFNIKKLPVVDFSFEKIKDLDYKISLNGKCIQNLQLLSSFAIYTKAAPGWNDYLNEVKK